MSKIHNNCGFNEVIGRITEIILELNTGNAEQKALLQSLLYLVLQVFNYEYPKTLVFLREIVDIENKLFGGLCFYNYMDLRKFVNGCIPPI